MATLYDRVKQFLMAYCQSLPAPDSDWPAQVNEIYTYIIENLFKDFLNISHLKRKFPSYQKHFPLEFENHVGRQPKAFIQYHRITCSKKLLKEFDELKIGQCGRAVGYRSTSAFCKAFRKATHLRPTEWKDQDD